MTVQEDKSLSILFARLDDLYRSADQGLLGGTSFLSPRELHFSRLHFSEMGACERIFEWGGYPDAERKKLYVLPDYMLGASHDDFKEYGFEVDICAVEVMGSGYRALSHRDFLGSVLGLGLERDVIGDILVYTGDKPRALIICDRAVSAFICENLSKVGSDTVRTKVIDLSLIELPERKLLHISDTVASARLDGVISAILSVSREKAKEMVSSGMAEVDYEICERPDKILTPPSIITVRGFGKFRVNSLCDKTKKGRLRLDADKFV